ncbi:ATP-dependent DNA helicase [Actinocorallia sp. A-T 12471]|uniref:ATP-dependent DNA helicase n=1 Tax=Actinocorallia sp. A-T 12471 TaxID=3089813 RepID=UPI0029D2E777|nr:ATP-dependent DNA helicase [Actinocorallia sp. A-T 12471]MDX6739926.1 ATP-dependent DNA helicase [Actinocorallia sp. A-T 12471]
MSAGVAAVGGSERPGQVKMVEAVDQALRRKEHLAVQAGTGTGKSLAYLVPSVRHAVSKGVTVVVSTATIALQQQLVDRDLPRLADALEPLLGRELRYAILKGRRNYVCLNRMSVGAPDDPEDGLFDTAQVSTLGRQVQRLNEWAEKTQTGDRDELVPGVSEQAWRQVAVSAKECLGAQRCPQAQQCFSELARAEAAEADVVVTNHAMLAIDALEEFQVLPEHDAVVIDEAHDLVDRVTSVASGELSANAVETAARRAGKLVADRTAERLRELAEDLKIALDEESAARLDMLPSHLGNTLTAVRDAAQSCLEGLGPEPKDADPAVSAARRAAKTSLDDVHSTVVRMLAAFEAPIADRWDVVWLAKSFDGKWPPSLHVAPIAVGGLLRDALFGTRTTILTSATLTLGGSFEPLARQWGLPAPGGPVPSVPAARDGEASDDEKPIIWSGLDVGSPFDYPRSGILYVAKHLPPPGRDGLPKEYLEELKGLIEAAGGRTLGLFSSMRAARQAADELEIDFPVLCQGDDSTSQLVRQFAESPETCLFGTLSLWQGVDVPGPSLSLVVMDRIPFPRPDDPVASARQRMIAARGGNGFMQVAAAQAALLLAQGAGRLVRSGSDKGVVAVLDPRLATARYGSFLTGSLPPFWPTSDPAQVRAALQRLTAD